MASKKETKSERIIHRVGTELKENPPRIVQQTRRKRGEKRAEAQRRAILLDKARRAGARIPRARNSSRR